MDVAHAHEDVDVIEARRQRELRRHRSDEFERLGEHVTRVHEHVGPRFYQAYFDKCRQLLKPDGVMLLHTIGLMDGPWYPNPWLDKYIFPGGQLPALSEIVPAVEQAGLIVTEATAISHQGQGYADVPGLYAPEQLAGWKKVTDAVHAAGGKIVVLGAPAAA